MNLLGERGRRHVASALEKHSDFQVPKGRFLKEPGCFVANQGLDSTTLGGGCECRGRCSIVAMWTFPSGGGGEGAGGG
jgi:hypothetical protein